MTGIEIRPLAGAAGLCATLGEMTVEAVAGGASLTFMAPLGLEDAVGFWERSLVEADRSGRVVLGAFVDSALVGTVTLLLDMPPNQRHRAEIAKMIVRRSHRGRGIAAALMGEAEACALRAGRTLLVLDTAAIGGAGGLYERLGFTRLGTIPDFALLPHGGFTGATFYWKRIG